MANMCDDTDQILLYLRDVKNVCHVRIKDIQRQFDKFSAIRQFNTIYLYSTINRA